jgi:hypothetical protein
MGIGDGLLNYDFKPFVDFLCGTGVGLIIIFCTPRFFAKEQKADYQFKGSMLIFACKYIFAGFALVLLIRLFGIYFLILYGFIAWVPIYIIVNFLKTNPESYLPTVIADVSTMICSIFFGIMAILIKPKSIYKSYKFLGFILGLFFGTALFYRLNILFLLLAAIGIIGSLAIDRIRQSTNFQKSDLTYANFTSANLEATDFAGAKLINTDFTDAKF